MIVCVMKKYLDQFLEVSRDEILNRSLDTMGALIDLSQSLAAARNLDSIMNLVRHGARELTGADGASFVLRDGDQCYYADEDAIQPLWKGSRFPMNICISGWAMQQHESAIIPDIYQDSRIPHTIYEPTFVQGLVVVPIRTDNPLGAIGCYWSTTHEASPFQVRLLQILANMTAIAMENIQHEAELEKRAEQLEKTFESTLMAVSRMIDQRDAYTAGHQRQVGEIAWHIAQIMNYSPDHCQAIKWAGVVHDVGKIAIPAEILSKPTKLTPVELMLVQTHSQAGYDILRDVEMNAPIADIVLQHHERLDGSGYPQGLTGDQILPEARLLAVADVFEAMVSHRPYRAALGYDAALAELKLHRESRYDPDVVDALIFLIEQKSFRLSEHWA